MSGGCATTHKHFTESFTQTSTHVVGLSTRHREGIRHARHVYCIRPAILPAPARSTGFPHAPPLDASDDDPSLVRRRTVAGALHASGQKNSEGFFCDDREWRKNEISANIDFLGGGAFVTILFEPPKAIHTRTESCFSKQIHQIAATGLFWRPSSPRCNRQIGVEQAPPRDQDSFGVVLARWTACRFGGGYSGSENLERPNRRSGGEGQPR